MSSKSLEEKVATKTRTQIKKFFNYDIVTKVARGSASISYMKGNVSVIFKTEFVQETMENKIIEMIGLATIPISTIDNYSEPLEKVTNEIRKIFIKEK